MIKDVERRFAEQRMEMIRMRARRHAGEHVGLRVTRDLIEQAFITHDCECPRLLIYRAGCVHRGVDQKTDYPLIDRLFRVFANRASTDDCFVEIL